MEFEFNAEKSASNKNKHGIDFLEAQALWRDGAYLDLDARSDNEHRFARIGRIGGMLWVAIYTLRGRSIRIISVRRAHDTERRRYEDHFRPGIR
ncbi:BrnT family toxin [Rhizobium deserti]|uniref:BrnT family toxin n=1 Tax=Rhizobium deserti TaxID=2547961 RepID=A0A4R5UMD4_9HYPH|nr:BrnT family toxin [Rhizobium deserti]TDK39047.1 BrnT family toxin [Rhizobium deserti]